MTPEQQQSLKELIAKGKMQGYLTYSEVNDHLPGDVVDPEQMEEIICMINDMGIEVHEDRPDTDMIAETAVVTEDDEEEAAEVAAALVSSVDTELGRTRRRAENRQADRGRDQPCCQRTRSLPRSHESFSWLI